MYKRRFNRCIYWFQLYILTYLLTYLLSYFLAYLLTYLVTFLLTYLLTYLLIYSMVQNPSSEPNWFAVSQEIPRISRNPKVHYRNHKRPPPCLYPGPAQSSPYTQHPTSWRSVIILTTNLCLGLPSSLLPSGFATKALYNHSPHPYAPHAQPISFFSMLSPKPLFVLLSR